MTYPTADRKYSIFRSHISRPSSTSASVYSRILTFPFWESINFRISSLSWSSIDAETKRLNYILHILIAIELSSFIHTMSIYKIRICESKTIEMLWYFCTDVRPIYTIIIVITVTMQLTKINISVITIFHVACWAIILFVFIYYTWFQKTWIKSCHIFNKESANSIYATTIIVWVQYTTVKYNVIFSRMTICCSQTIQQQ